MFKVFDDIDESTMDKVVAVIIEAALKVKQEVNIAESKITICCEYKDDRFDAFWLWNFSIELGCTFTEQALVEGQICDRRLKKIYYDFENNADAYLFAQKIYNAYKAAFGESGHDKQERRNLGITFASGSLDFDLHKGTGINFLCFGINPNNFINTGESPTVDRQLVCS